MAPVTLVDVVGALGPRATNAKQLFGADALRAMATGPRISHAAPQLRATKPLDKELDGNFIAEMLEDAPGLLNMEAMAPGERLECQTLEALDAMEEGKRPGEEALLKLLSPLLDRSHSASGTLRAAAMMAAVSGRHWKILRRLMRSQPLESLVYAPELAGALADANQVAPSSLIAQQEFRIPIGTAGKGERLMEGPV